MNRSLLILCVFLAVLVCTDASAVDVNDNADGAWNNTATWNPNAIPGAIDNVTIDSHDVTAANSANTCSSLVTQSGSTLTISDNLAINHGRFGGAVTQLAGRVEAAGFSRGDTQFKNISDGGYIMNGGELIIGYNAAIGGQKTTVAYGRLTVNNGMVYARDLRLGYPRHGELVITGGAVTNWNNDLRVALGNNGFGTIDISGGKLHSDGQGIHLGGGAPVNEGRSTGVVTQTGGIIDADGDLILGYLGAGEYNLSGGSLEVGGTCWNNLHSNDLPYTTLSIIGAGCTNFTVGGDFAIGGGRTTLRALVEPDGITLIDVAGDIYLTNMVIELGATNNYNGDVNDTFELMRTPQANIITTNNLSVTNIDEKFVFGLTIENYASYDWVVLTHLHPPKASCIIVK